MKALSLYEKAAKKNVVSAQLKCGEIYEDSANERHKSLAFKYYLKASILGNAEAQLAIADFYFEGIGVKMNRTRAIEWYEKSANNDNFEAKSNLASIFYMGNDVEKNITRALYWYEKIGNVSTENSVKESRKEYIINAQEILGGCFYNGEGVERNITNSIKWYEKAAILNSTESQIALGTIYSTEEDVKNESEAFKWFLMSAEQRSEYAQLINDDMLFKRKSLL